MSAPRASCWICHKWEALTAFTWAIYQDCFCNEQSCKWDHVPVLKEWIWFAATKVVSPPNPVVLSYNVAHCMCCHSPRSACITLVGLGREGIRDWCEYELWLLLLLWVIMSPLLLTLKFVSYATIPQIATSHSSTKLHPSYWQKLKKW